MKKGMIFMKINAKFKSFTDGLAIFLAVLIAVYLMTGFIQIGSKKSSDNPLDDTPEPNFHQPQFFGKIILY